jgi:hypothetical protein
MVPNLEIGSVFSSASPMAEAILRLLYLLLILGTGVLAVIAAIVVISATRFRDRGREVPHEDEGRRAFWILGLGRPAARDPRTNRAHEAGRPPAAGHAVAGSGRARPAVLARGPLSGTRRRQRDPHPGRAALARADGVSG